MMKITLKNSFHNTETTIIPKEILDHGDNLLEVRISKEQAIRARKTLCGCASCTCSGIDGTRGKQYLSDGRRFYTEVQELVDRFYR